jgi:aminoglycoside 3-N-acetyltransferase I
MGGHSGSRLSSADVVLRRLAGHDIDLLRAVLALYAAAFDDPRSYTGAQPDDGYLGSLLLREDFIQIVALAEGHVVGAASAYVLPKFEQARSEIYIYDLAVAEQHRRRGIAERMIGELRGLARQIGAWVIYVQADHGDDPAIALYTKLGVREDVLHFDIAP